MSKAFFSNKKNVLLGLCITLGGLVLAWALVELFRASEAQSLGLEDDVFFGQNEESVYKPVDGDSSDGDSSKETIVFDSPESLESSLPGKK